MFRIGWRANWWYLDIEFTQGQMWLIRRDRCVYNYWSGAPLALIEQETLGL